MSEELKPCPFCGGEQIQNYGTACEGKYFVQVCTKCGANGPVAKENDAGSAWNRRACPWVDVRERLPLKDGRYLVRRPYTGIGYLEISNYSDKGWFLQGVTHWAPLPEPPGEEAR